MGAKSGKRGPDPGHGGRSVLALDVEVMKRAASIGCTKEETAALLGISRSLFFDRLHEDPSLRDTFDEAADNGRATLRRLQWQRAANGSDTMLIWLGKQLLGQRDHHELTGPDGGALTLQVITGVAREAAQEIDGEAQEIGHYQIGSDD